MRHPWNYTERKPYFTGTLPHMFCDNITNGICGEMGVMRREVEEGAV